MSTRTLKPCESTSSILRAGAYVAEALRGFFSGLLTSNEAGDSDVRELPSLELISSHHPPVPTSLGPIRALQQELYQAPPRSSASALSPFFSVTIREGEDPASPPGGPVAISVVMDQLAPRLERAGSEGMGTARLSMDCYCGSGQRSPQQRRVLVGNIESISRISETARLIQRLLRIPGISWRWYRRQLLAVGAELGFDELHAILQRCRRGAELGRQVHTIAPTG